MKKGSKILVKLLVVIIAWSVLAGIVYVFYKQGREDRVEVSVKKEIEKAIEVKGLQNKFVFTRGIIFGGAGGGGMGAPVVICSSAEQFVELVPEGEKVYVAFEFPVINEKYGTKDYRSIKKVYWAFIENRAGLMTHEYTYSHKNYQVERYTPEVIYFYYNNRDDIQAVTLLVAMVGIVLVGWLSITIFKW